MKIKLLIFVFLLESFTMVLAASDMRMDRFNSDAQVKENVLISEKINTNTTELPETNEQEFVQNYYSLSSHLGHFWSPFLTRAKESGWTPEGGRQPYGYQLGLEFSRRYPINKKFSVGWTAGYRIGFISYYKVGFLEMIIDGAANADEDSNSDYKLKSDLAWIELELANRCVYKFNNTIAAVFDLGFSFGWFGFPTINPVLDAMSIDRITYLGWFTGVGLRYILKDGAYVDLRYRVKFNYLSEPVYTYPLERPLVRHSFEVGLGLCF